MVVGPRKALSTSRVSGPRIPPSALAARSSSPYSNRCRAPAGEAVQFISTARPIRSGNRAANVPPIMPPHELPTKCARCTPRPSSRSTTTWAQSAKLKGAVSLSLPPWPGGSINTTRWSAPNASACPAHMSPVISRLGQNRMTSPVPRVCTRNRPSVVGNVRASIR